MSNLPKGAKKVTYEPEGSSLPKGAKRVEYNGPTPEEAAQMPMPEPTRSERVLEYLRTKGPIDAAEDYANWAPDKIRAGLMGVTSNAAPHILAAVDAAGDLPVFSSDEEIDAARSKKLPGYQQQYGNAATENPGFYVGGAIAQPSPFGKAKAASTIGKVGLAVARTGYAGANGALADYLGRTGPEAQDTGVLPEGAALPMAMQAGAEALSPVAGKLAGKLRNTAGNAAVNAAGMRGGIVNQPKRAGIHTLDESGDDAISALGNRMLDEGLIPFGGDKLAVQRRAEKMMGQAGGAAEAIRTRADMAGKFDQALGVKAAAGSLSERIDPAMGGNLQTARASKPAREFITDAANTPDTFKAADDLKRGAYGSTNWSTVAPDAQKLKRQTVGAYRQSIEDQVDGLLPGEGKSLHRANEKYGLAAQTADFAEEAAGRERANRKFGPIEMLMSVSGATAGGAQFGAGGAAAGAAIPLLSHFAKTRGAATAAPLARMGSKAADAARAANQSPAGSAAAGSVLEDYLRPMDDEERQKKGIKHFTGQ